MLVVVGHISKDSANTVGDTYRGIAFPKTISSRAFFQRKEVSGDNCSPFHRGLLQLELHFS